METTTRSEAQPETRPASTPANSPAQPRGASDLEVMTSQVGDALAAYGKKNPGAIACGIFLAGFVVGWKLKPW